METRDGFVGTAGGVKHYRENPSEAYVEIPPAYVITDERGDIWTIGHRYNPRMEYEVLRNDRSTGEYASRVVFLAGKVRIFSRAGWKVWSGASFI